MAWRKPQSGSVRALEESDFLELRLQRDRFSPMVRPKLLCVDDDPAFRELYRTMLGGYGYDVVLAADGADALRAFHSCPTDAVVIDHEMPVMNGSEVAAAIKGINPNIPIVMVSGCEAVVEGIPRFVDAAIAKGSEVGLLLDKLELLVGPRAASLSSGNQISRLVPLGSALATVALAAYVLPRLWR